MCGINGFNWNNSALIARMNHITRHRGPDGEGFYRDENVSLGHRRLSIIDLSEHGNQPLANEDGSLQIVFNGEMYNYRALREQLLARGHHFCSETDTEVLLHAYEDEGLACLERFNGMWAFCIYDRRRRQIVLCRDRFGIKPLYYHLAPGKLIFSSMLAAVLCHDIPARPNDRAIMEYLAFNLSQHSDYTFFEGIQSLLPGHALIYDLTNGTHRMVRWYKPQASGVESAAQLRQLFIDSVAAHTVSDVPVGVSLSGGVDSTAITLALNQILPGDFQTFSLEAPGSRVDERRYIEAVGACTRTQQHFTTAGVETFLEDLNDFIEALEEPVAHLSVYASYRVHQLAHNNGIKVLLNGQGGDELFAGYVYYFAYYYYDLLRQGKLVRLVSEMWQTWRNFGDLMPHQTFAFLLLPDRLRRALWRKFQRPWLNHDLLEKACAGQMDPRWQRMGIKEILDRTLFSTAIPHLLIWADKCAMRWGVEGRVPFLDVHLVEAARGIDPALLLRDGQTKRLFKTAVDDLLPPLVRQRRDKIGFEAPLDDFLRHPRAAALVHDIIHSDSFKSRPYWHWNNIAQTLQAHQEGRTNAGQTLWKCINLELWLRQWFTTPQDHS